MRKNAEMPMESPRILISVKILLRLRRRYATLRWILIISYRMLCQVTLLRGEHILLPASVRFGGPGKAILKNNDFRAIKLLFVFLLKFILYLLIFDKILLIFDRC
jgi:hypothetical protein